MLAAQLSRQNLELIQILGIAAVAVQFVLESIQYSMSSKQASLLISD